MANQWFKFYGGEFLSDPKIASLTLQEKMCWVTLMCLASTSSTQGLVEYLTVEVLLQKSGILFDPYHPEEWDKSLGVLMKFERMKMITKHANGNIELLNWNKRQEYTMTATERSRKFRANQKENPENATHATKCNENATLEENRIEENRIDNSNSVAEAPQTSTKKFQKPTVEEIQDYITEKGYKVDAHRFWHFYESKGWKIGKNPMVSWKSGVATWAKDDKAIKKNNYVKI